jgi:hypothetical protein
VEARHGTYECFPSPKKSSWSFVGHHGAAVGQLKHVNP